MYSFKKGIIIYPFKVDNLKKLNLVSKSANTWEMFKSSCSYNKII